MDTSLNDSKTIDEFLYPLFWEYKPESINIVKHSDLIMSRIMEQGTWESMQWLKKTYTSSALVAFLEKKGFRILPPRELNFWAFISGVSDNKRKKLINQAKEHNDVWQKRHIY